MLCQRRTLRRKRSISHWRNGSAVMMRSMLLYRAACVRLSLQRMRSWCGPWLVSPTKCNRYQYSVYRHCHRVGAVNKYKVIIYWSEEDQVYIAEVPELPGCLAHGVTREAAMASVQEAIALWIETAEEFGD